MTASRSLLSRLKPFAQGAIDAGVAAAALGLAMLVRYEFAIPSATYGQMAWTVLPLVMLVGPLVNWMLGSYRQMWMYTSLRETRVVAASAAALFAVLVTMRLAGVEFAPLIVMPYSIALLTPTFYAVGSIGVRMLRRQQVVAIWSRRAELGQAQRTLVVGAGRAASALVLDAAQSGERRLLVGLLDDDPQKQGRRLHGVQVVGTTADLERVVRESRVERVLLAMPSADPDVVRSLLRRAEATGATVRVLPSVRRALDGTDTDNPPTLADLVDAEEVKRTLLGRLDAPGRERRVLVTGGAGYIGNFLVRRLLAEGYTVRVLDNLTFGDAAVEDLRDHERFELVEGDISNLRDVSRAVKDVSTVVALAALVGDPACGVDAEETLTLNFESTKALTEACRFYGVDRLVFASSCSVYGASEGDETLTETSPLNPVSLYARTRILSEEVVFSRCGATTPVVLRLATVYGLSPRMRFDLVVNTLTVRGVVDGRFQIFGGDQWRPFVHCADVAEAFFLAATAPRERVAGQTFNVGSDAMNYTIAEVGDIVAEEIAAAGLPTPAVEHHDAGDDARNYRVTFGKIREALGFVPRYDLRAGIRDMVAGIRDSPELRDYRGTGFSNVEVLRQRLAPVAGDGASADGTALPPTVNSGALR